jgi:hypothetical protein
MNFHGYELAYVKSRGDINDSFVRQTSFKAVRNSEGGSVVEYAAVKC